MKRDDCTGLGTGGNKTRKLEFLIGAAEAEGSDVVLTFGAVQSNHARQTAAACAARGLPCHLILARKVPWHDPNYENLGNVLLDRLFGAHLHVVEADSVSAHFQSLLTDLRAAGRNPYVIPTGGSNATGALGYAACALELADQCREKGVDLRQVVHATSSAGTQAGLLAGFEMGDLTSQVAVQGIDVSEGPTGRESLVETILEIANGALSLAGADTPLNADRVHVDSDYLGDGYGLPTPATIEAIRLVAGTEGILLDPVYSGKAMSGLIGRIRTGEVGGGDVVFVHTGGAAVLPVYGESFR
jgi:D-cysteine desulfhydrase family pyridoxal phosphate-dependent enzyme